MLVTNVYQLLVNAAEAWPNQIALVDEHGEITFRQLLLEVESIREQLRRAGLSQGQGLGLMARNGRAFVLGLFAGLGCEAVVVPFSHQLKRAEIDDLLQSIKLHAILDDGSGIQPIEAEAKVLSEKPYTLKLSWTQKPPAEAVVPHIKDAAFVRFSSGTTGQAKGVIVSHQSVLERIEGANRELTLQPGESVVWVLPMAFHFIVSIMLYVRYGVTMIVAPDLLADNIIRLTNRYKGTLIYGSPFHFRMLASDRSGQVMPTLKRAVSTAMAMPVAIAKAFKNRYGLNIDQAYGIIEIGLPIINRCVSEENLDAVGYAVDGYQVEMLNEQGEVLPIGEIGKLGIKGPGMFDGYLSPPSTRADHLENGWFMTGDLAAKTPEGLIRVKGREKSMINVAGNKVFPEEVESILNLHANIFDSHVYGKIHPLMGEIVHADLILKPDVEFDSEEVLSFCRKKLSTYKIPQTLAVVAEISRTKTGKIVRAGSKQAGSSHL